MKSYVVMVDALGLINGTARKGETITESQIADLERLLINGYIVEEANPNAVTESPPVITAVPETTSETPEPVATATTAPAPTPPAEDEPYTSPLTTLFAVGLLPPDDYTLTDEDQAWARGVQTGEVEVPFNPANVESIGPAELRGRIEALGVDPPADDESLADSLMEAVMLYFMAWDVDSGVMPHRIVPAPETTNPSAANTKGNSKG